MASGMNRFSSPSVTRGRYKMFSFSLSFSLFGHIYRLFVSNSQIELSYFVLASLCYYFFLTFPYLYEDENQDL